MAAQLLLEGSLARKWQWKPGSPKKRGKSEMAADPWGGEERTGSTTCRLMPRCSRTLIRHSCERWRQMPSLFASDCFPAQPQRNGPTKPYALLRLSKQVVCQRKTEGESPPGHKPPLDLTGSSPTRPPSEWNEAQIKGGKFLHRSVLIAILMDRTLVCRPPVYKSASTKL